MVAAACTHEEIIGETEEAGVRADVGEGVEGEAAAAAAATMLELYRREDTGSKDARTTAVPTIEYYMSRVLYSSCAKSFERLSIRQNDQRTCTKMLTLS